MIQSAVLGKPLPVRSAALFYREHADHAGAAVFDPARQLQWLVDTPARLRDYLALAEGLGTRLRINIELDVGLHRGGVADRETLRTMLEIIRDNPQRLGFAGFMGYDPFVVMLPALLGSRETLLARVLSVYQEQVALLHEAFPGLGTPAAGEPAPTFNTAGSPTYRLHEAERVPAAHQPRHGLLKAQIGRPERLLRVDLREGEPAGILQFAVGHHFADQAHGRGFIRRNRQAGEDHDLLVGEVRHRRLQALAAVGLGLALARAIAQRHRLSLTLLDGVAGAHFLLEPEDRR